MFKTVLSKVVGSVVTTALAITGAIIPAAAIPAAAAETPTVVLNGTVNSAESGFLNSKSVILSSGKETKVNYRLTPSYAAGSATDVTVTIYMPSLKYDEASQSYTVVPRGEPATALGVQGRVSAGSGWNVLSDTTVKGGPIVMQLDGDLSAGSNPAFDLFLSTYNDGSNGVYGSVPEGTAFEINGFTRYEMFNRVPGSSWETPGLLDNDSRISVISSDLTWDAGIKTFEPENEAGPFPIWDRYQYADYIYNLKNTSDNLASNIDGYSVTFDIESILSSPSGNGIIPFDINRFIYNPNGAPTPNPDPENSDDTFVGVPGEGGVLIYAIPEDWDGDRTTLGSPLPYVYGGDGMIILEHSEGDAKKMLTPEGAAGDTANNYLISLPLSRQGFPNLPTNFKMRAITNVLFAKTANWTKTHIVEREITLPTYDLSYTHTPKQTQVVYGYETYNEIANIKSNSNAPIFDAKIKYTADKNFTPTKVVYEVPTSELEKMKSPEITYSYKDKDSGETVTKTLKSFTSTEENDVTFLEFDVSSLGKLDWDKKFQFTVADKIARDASVPLKIRVYGEVYEVGEANFEADFEYIEKIASNDDYGQNTSYTNVPHNVVIPTKFTVIYPNEVIPNVRFKVNGTFDKGNATYNKRSTIDVLFGTNNNPAKNSTVTLELNKQDAQALKDVNFTLKKELLTYAEDVTLSYETLTGEKNDIPLDGFSETEDFTVALPKDVAKVFIKTEQLSSNGGQHFATIDAVVANGIVKKHIIDGTIRTYQPKPYDKDTTKTNTGELVIALPAEVNPKTTVTGVYGNLKTATKTQISYEADFFLDFALTTGPAASPESEYRIELLKPTARGELEFKGFTLSEEFLASNDSYEIILLDKSGKEQTFKTSEVLLDAVNLDDVAAILVKAENLNLPTSTVIGSLDVVSSNAMGSSQGVKATFTGNQNDPYTTSKTATDTNTVTVFDTKTAIDVEGVNQVTKNLGVGNDYSVEIYKWWGQGYTYNTRDYTLDQGYKSLGGFTSSLTRPTQTFANNDQTTRVNVALPYQHFDLYYVKLRDDVKDYVTDVKLYRMVDGKEELWKTIPGDEWVENTQEGSKYWRIATARPENAGNALYETFNSPIGVKDHPYYKDAWEATVVPESPISRVDVGLKFERLDNSSAPQMSGAHNDVIEYMGRFYTPSSDGKKATKLVTTDTFGKKVKEERTAEKSINSLVHYPFAQSATGAQDRTNLANKVVPMGIVSEYLASVWNVTNQNWSYYSGHGPDIYSPAATEYDEWLGLYDPSSFHDKLIYEFVYPASPNVDEVYNFEAKHVKLANPAFNKYLTGISVEDENGEKVTLKLTKKYTSELTVTYNHSLSEGIYENEDGTITVSLGEGNQPAKVRFHFEEIAGFGDNTAEIAGLKQDTLGANLNEIDLRIGGIVNGNKALKGTTNLYRDPAYRETAELMHTSSATLTGYTPKLGAKVWNTFDQRDVYDYGLDGITPNETRATVGIENSSEADIKDISLSFTPDANFRSRLLEIPEAIFQERDWSVKTVKLKQGTKVTEISLDKFKFNEETKNYELDLVKLFEAGVLDSKEIKVTVGGEATLLQNHITEITVDFEPKDSTVRLWGKLARDESEESLPIRMLDGGDFFVTGVWVDETETGSDWLSKPTFVTNTTKANYGSVTAWTSFKTSAAVEAYQPLFVSAGGGNAGQNPVLTLNSYYGDAAPRLFARVANMQLHGTHLNNDLTKATDKLFFDADTNAQVSATNITPGDTAKVLYELRNIGKTAAADNTIGALPVFNPVAHLTVPADLEISDIQVTGSLFSNTAIKATMDESPNTAVTFNEDAIKVTRVSKTQVDVEYTGALNPDETLFFFVEYTAVNSTPADKFFTQNRAVTMNTYARPMYAHQYMSYSSNGVSSNGIVGGATTVDLDGLAGQEHVATVRNSPYRFSNPNQLQVTNQFLKENVSGEEMSITVDKILNETLHDNTELVLDLTLDTNKRGFELKKFPTPVYPEGFTGDFAEPKVFFKAGSDWIEVKDFDKEKHSLKEINELRIDYGRVPASFNAPGFTVSGVGHWQQNTTATVKSYTIQSSARTTLTHFNGDELSGAYTYLTNNSKVVYKAIPKIEFNIQSFDTREEAEAPYSGSATGKTSFVAGDKINYKVTAKNINDFQGLATNTPYGKAPLYKPVIFDKVPEYVTTELDAFIKNDKLDVQAAIDAGALKLSIYGADENARPIELPEVTVKTVEGLDIAGAQEFSNARLNDGYGRLSASEPIDTKENPAKTIEFTVFEYNFADETLGRGETLEIVYTAEAFPASTPNDKAPIAMYKNGKAVFAPLYGWYESNNPVASNANKVTMDMASLLHDAGITGNKGHEMTSEEFMSSSYSWQPGGLELRRNANDSSSSSLQRTWYDATANSSKSHIAHLKETANNDLYETFTSSNKDDNFDFAARGRVNDKTVTADERILWTQDSIQLNRAWLYGASEMVPDTKRSSHGVSDANFYETDKKLNSLNVHRHGYSPYAEDDYSYAVELHEEFTVKLHASNLGDRAIESGLKYTEILPLGVTPYSETGEILGIQAYDGQGNKIASSYKVIQTPEQDAGFRAPAQSQEAGTYKAETRDDMIPYVVVIEVETPLSGMFNNPAATAGKDKNQSAEIRVRVFEELAPSKDGLSYWHDEFTVTSIEKEEYMEIYSKEYGAFNKPNNWENRIKFPNDGMVDGLETNDLSYDFGYYTSYVSFEPYGKYVRGLNAQGTTVESDGKPALVTGDQLLMRKPTLRVWSNTTKGVYSGDYHDSIENFYVQPYEKFTINSIVENQQLEVLGEYNRNGSGYNYNSGDNFNSDIWDNAPQTIGGARGSWFEPTVTVALPYGVAPVLEDGTISRYYEPMNKQQKVAFNATVNDITFDSSKVARDVTDALSVKVELVEDAEGKRFVLHFKAEDAKAATVAYGQALVVSPRVAVIDTPIVGSDVDASKYQEIVTLAGTVRPVFNPIVSDKYTTGAVPTTTARDLGVSSAPNNRPSNNGKTIATNDRTRLDSTSAWKNNMGALKITDRLIAATKQYSGDSSITLDKGSLWKVPASTLVPEDANAKHAKSGAYGGVTLMAKQPTINNETKTSTYADSLPGEKTQVDAAGKFWYQTEIKNELKRNENPYEEFKSTGDVFNSKFLVTHYVTNFAEATNEVRLKIGDELLTRAEFEALGYSVERVTPQDEKADEKRNRIQWVVTTPAGDTGTRGDLAAGESFTLLYQAHMIAGYEDSEITEETVWTAPELTVDSYVSVITDDKSLITGAQDPRDFISQKPSAMFYKNRESDENKNEDIDSNGEMTEVYAHDTAVIEILKPRVELRVNTERPRIPYSNGLSGDTYFNSSDMIDYMATYVKVTGSGLKKLVVENVLPSHTTNDPTVKTTAREINTSTHYVSTGKWELPEETLTRIAATGKTVDDFFKTYVYISHDDAEAGFEEDGWTLLNPGGTSILENKQLTIPTADRNGLKKFRVVVEALHPADILVPNGARLAVDADPTKDGSQEVIETDPDNHSVTSYPVEVTENAIHVGMRISSNIKTSLFIYDTLQGWGNYVGDSISKLAQSETRSYLTPSRPVVNVKYDTLYYRSDNTKPQNERFGWSDITTISPKSSPHLKFKGQFINADNTMWERSEDNVYAEDALIDPFITFQLPTVMEAGGEFTYVPESEIDSSHPLNDDHRSRYSLTEKENNLWTWKIVHADGTEAHPESSLKHTRLYAGPWNGSNRNHVSVWFEGTVFPGDMIVVELIGSVDAYSPGAANDDLKSRALITNSTGMLQPLNSNLNVDNKLGYSLDSNDFNENGIFNDRLVFAERSMFEYESYDNFGKRKIAYSNLNKAGTVYPDSTPVEEGGNVTFELSVDNSKEASETAYPYPIFYDVLPHKGDTSIIDENVARNSTYASILDPESVKLEIDGADKKVYAANDYTVFVGPLKKEAGKIVEAPLVPHAQASTEAFFDSLGTPGTASPYRDAHFVKLDEVKNDPKLLKQVKSVLVMLNNSKEVLPGQNKMKFTYQVKTPLNAPAYLEQFDEASKKADAEIWNSFMATQRTPSFKPQESNKAGAHAVERSNNVYIGNYVWNDANFDGIQNEGDLITDENGRKLLKPSKDIDFDGKIDDPGIDGVKVTLLSKNGNYADRLGQAIKQDGDEWFVIDDATGDFILEDVFGQKIKSDGPLTTVTREDIHGNKGYYTFSNIAASDYRVMFEMPASYNAHGVTTLELFKNSAVETFKAGEKLGLPIQTTASTLTAVSAPASVTLETTDEERMAFDLGVAQTVKIGGEIFKENLSTLDGLKQPTEKGIAGYHVKLMTAAGAPALDHKGQPLVVKTDAAGKYEFTLLPRDRAYYVEVTDTEDKFNYETIVSPILHNVDPFKASNDNDGFTPKGSTQVKTNTLDLNLEGLYTSKFADRMSVSVGFYDKTTYGTVGNRVWNDVNRDGIQDASEAGIAGQELFLEQYIDRKGDGTWEKTSYTKSTKSNADGYYYFTEVPSVYSEGSGANKVNFETRYQVTVKKLVTGYTFTTPRIGENNEIDSDFYPNGTLHETAVVGENLFSLASVENGVTSGVDNSTIDLGLVAHALTSLSGEIFMDTNKDGLKNDAETPESIYTATLEVKHNGAWVTARHDANGLMIEPRKALPTDAPYSLENVNAYNFENLHIIENEALTPYEYRVVVTGIPLWQTVTALRVGDDTTLDNDFKHAARSDYSTANSEAYLGGKLQTGQLHPIETFTALPAENDDLGLYNEAMEATIGDFIWYDLNENGLQDAGELGAPGVRVVLNELVAGELVPVRETTTDAAGKYEFTAPVSVYDPKSKDYNKAIEYVVEFAMTSRQSLTEANVGNDETLNSKFVKLASKTGSLYENSVKDLRHTVVSAPFTLAEHGAYGFVDYATVENTSIIDGGLIVHETVRVIGDTVYEDKNKNGSQEPDEPGIAGIAVKLYNFNKTTGEWELFEDLNGNSTLTTDANGHYEFAVEVADLDKDSAHYRTAEEYRVMLTPPSNMRLVEINNEFSYQTDANVAGLPVERPQSDVVTAGFTLVDLDVDNEVILPTAVDHLTADAGFNIYPTRVTIGGLYWEDSNLNGIQDEDEKPEAGHVVTLWENIAGEWTKVEDLEGNSTQVTDEKGEYRFIVAPTFYEELESNFLQEREYKVTLEREGWQVWSPLHAGEDRTLDSDIEIASENFGNAHTGMTQIFSIADVENGKVDLTSVRDDLEMDLGVKSYASTVKLGGVYWNDSNFNNVRDKDEAPLAGRTVVLYKQVDDKFIPVLDVQKQEVSTKTDASGGYLFEVSPVESWDPASEDYLKPIEYRVLVEKNGNELWVTPFATEDTTLDSDTLTTHEFSGLPQGSVYGTMGLYSLFDKTEENLVDISSVRDDLYKDAGVQSFAQTVTLGGVVWNDEKNNNTPESGEPRLAGQTVTLQEKVAGKWVTVEDVNGNSTRKTDKTGAYEFEVAPTSYDFTKPGFLQARAYRVVMEIPAGYELGKESIVTKSGEFVVTPNAQLVTFNDASEVAVDQVTSDKSLNFPFVLTPEDAADSSGGNFFWLAILGFAFGVVVIAYSFRRRTENN